MTGDYTALYVSFTLVGETTFTLFILRIMMK